jgi:hypothetical protein
MVPSSSPPDKCIPRETDEILELGLLNVVQDVWIKATDIDNATQTFVIPASGISSQKKVLLDVLLASEEAHRGGRLRSPKKKKQDGKHKETEQQDQPKEIQNNATSRR